MREIEIRLSGRVSTPVVIDAVEQACALEGLAISLRGTLSKYPGCIHWHLRKGRGRGTLELTWWPQGRRLWFKIAEGRGAAWTEAAILRLRGTLEATLVERREKEHDSSRT